MKHSMHGVLTPKVVPIVSMFIIGTQQDDGLKSVRAGQHDLPPHVVLKQFCQKQLNLSLNGDVVL
jgi:hypothetical protein